MRGGDDGECSEMLSNIFLQEGLEDRWKWLLTPENVILLGRCISCSRRWNQCIKVNFLM